MNTTQLTVRAAVVACLFHLAGCKTAAPSSPSSGLQSDDVVAVATPDYGPATSLGLNQEYVPPGEEAFLAAAAQRFRAVHVQQQAQNQAQLGGSVVWRGMHAKAQGCMTGKLTVTNQDPALGFGLFKSQDSYDVVARFSNGSGLLQSDMERDLHGFALKVRGVADAGLDGASQAGEQDFLMTNAPAHHAQDIVELMNFIEANAAGGLKKAEFLAAHPRLALTLLKQTSNQVFSVINEPYWSRAAYRLGPDQMMKFLVKPCAHSEPLFSQTGIDQYLSKDLDHQAQHQEICFNLYVQLQQDPATEPVENYAVEWKTDAHQVATVTFPVQTPDHGDTCEHLVFIPWNAEKDLEPVGNFNRARRYVYKAAEAFRQGG